MSDPTFFGEGNTPRPRDTLWKIEQKILGAVLDGGGGGVFGNPWVDMALNGAQPPVDGSVGKYQVHDTDSGFRWYNSGTLASPVWAQ